MVRVGGPLSDTLLLFLLYPYKYSVDEKSGRGEDLGSKREKRGKNNCGEQLVTLCEEAGQVRDPPHPRLCIAHSLSLLCCFLRGAN